jgi:glutamate-1-semialdehyde aminotransferase
MQRREEELRIGHAARPVTGRATILRAHGSNHGAAPGFSPT